MLFRSKRPERARGLTPAAAMVSTEFMWTTTPRLVLRLATDVEQLASTVEQLTERVTQLERAVAAARSGCVPKAGNDELRRPARLGIAGEPSTGM